MDGWERDEENQTQERQTEPKGDDNDDDCSSGGETKYMVQSVTLHKWYSLADHMVPTGQSIDKVHP